MSYKVSKYPNGAFCWSDLMSTDAKKSKEFMVNVMGWSSKDVSTDKGIDYTMFFVGEDVVAGLSPIPKDKSGMPSVWFNYVAVDNLDRVLDKVESLGGKITMPKMKVMEAGSMAGIQDNAGAHLMLWEAGEHIGASLVNTVGAMGWNEMYSNDLEKAKEFYTGLFGWTFEKMPEHDNYEVIKNNGRSNGGAMKIQEDWPEMPSIWMVYFTVENLDKTMESVKKHGGSVKNGPMEAKGVGRFAVIEDPTGAVFTTIEMEGEAEHWIDPK